MGEFKKIPKGCGQCNNKFLELYELKVRCLRCAWIVDLSSINDHMEQMRKRKHLSKDDL